MNYEFVIYLLYVHTLLQLVVLVKLLFYCCLVK